MNLGEFLDRRVQVKVKLDKKIYGCYGCCFDYRVGCDLCENGCCCGLEVNMYELARQDTFFLNDINIIPEEWYKNLKFESLYICEREEHFPFLKFIREKIGDLRSTECYEFNKETNVFEMTRRGLTPSEEGPFVICCRCFMWLQIVNPILAETLVKISPFEIFWRDALKDDILEFVDFCSPEDEEYIHKKMMCQSKN